VVLTEATILKRRPFLRLACRGVRRGFAAFGIVLAVAAAGCGGGGSSGPRGITPEDLPRIHAEFKKDMDARLKRLGRPAKEIACVDRNIEAMGLPQVAERIVESAPVEPPSKETAAQAEGPLGKGCP
jgi:hypothetical protein